MLPMNAAEIAVAVVNKGGEGLRLSIITPIIRSLWSRQTASPSLQASWTVENPALGQCAVTALLVQQVLGGTIIRTVVERYGSHYYNTLPGGEIVDLTRGQFPNGTDIPQGNRVERSAILESERAVAAKTQERYELLEECFYRTVDEILDRISATIVNDP